LHKATFWPYCVSWRVFKPNQKEALDNHVVTLLVMSDYRNVRRIKGLRHAPHVNVGSWVQSINNLAIFNDFNWDDSVKDKNGNLEKQLKQKAINRRTAGYST